MSLNVPILWKIPSPTVESSYSPLSRPGWESRGSHFSRKLFSIRHDLDERDTTMKSNLGICSTLRWSFAFGRSNICTAVQPIADDEFCGTCGPQVSVSGSFTHHKDNARVEIEGAGDNAAIFREDVNGPDFTVSIATLPAGKYTITIGVADTTATATGERVFTIVSGDTTLAKDFDIFAKAGGARKVTTISGTVEHADDALRGPLKISFVASKGVAKFNTIEVKNAEGTAVASFSASELTDAFSAAAARVPDVSEASIWRDPAKPLDARIDDLIRRMSLAEKVTQLKNAAPAIARLVPAIVRLLERGFARRR